MGFLGVSSHLAYLCRRRPSQPSQPAQTVTGDQLARRRRAQARLRRANRKPRLVVRSVQCGFKVQQTLLELSNRSNTDNLTYGSIVRRRNCCLADLRTFTLMSSRTQGTEYADEPIACNWSQSEKRERNIIQVSLGRFHGGAFCTRSAKKNQRSSAKPSYLRRRLGNIAAVTCIRMHAAHCLRF